MKSRIGFPRWNLWGWIFFLFMAGGFYAFCVRFKQPVSLSSSGPSSSSGELILGLNVLCGFAIAVGCFTVAATIYVLHLKDCRSILRASLLASLLGYFVAILGLVSSSTRNGSTGMGSGPSFLYGIVWAMMLVGAVILLEFAPDLSMRLGVREPPEWIRALAMPLLFAAVVFSVLYQTRLAELLQALPEKVSPLWSTPELPFFFFVSSICAGLAINIFASWHLNRSLDGGLPADRVAALAKILAVVLFVYLGNRVADLLRRGSPILVWRPNSENMLLGLEFSLMLLPLLLLVNEKHVQNPRTVYVCSAIVLAGLMTNRLNTCITSVEAATHVKYLPDWKEFLIAYSIMALGIAGFRLMAKRLAIYGTFGSSISEGVRRS